MAAVGTVNLPIIDLKTAQDPAQRLAVAGQLVRALETVGFLYVDNVHGYDSQRLLTSAQWFFDLSQTERNKVARKIWNPDSPNNYRGYFPVQPGETSFKEGFEVGQDNPHTTNNLSVYQFLTEPNVWPTGMEGADEFRTNMVYFHKILLNASIEILRLTSLGSGLEENWFEPMFFPDSLSTLRLLRYPPRNDVVPEAAKDGDTVMACTEHCDTGVVTLLDIFHYSGLQICLDGKWLEVPRRPNALVMNIGDILSTMSGGRFKATVHRVVDTDVNRISVPFFLEPRFTADINRMMPGPEKASTVEERVKAECTAYGDHLLEKMRGFAEYKYLLASIEATAPKAC